MTMKRLYRIENPDTMEGLWYNSQGEYTEYVKTLDHGQCRELPMPHDETLAGGWFSACHSPLDLLNWFSPADLAQLQERGYGMYRVDVPADDCLLLPDHAAFRRERASLTELAPLTVLADLQAATLYSVKA